ncbi:hypothetical protein [Faecalicatena contorta]|uniref:Uncharacterized protein n=1 Tax=Faecalicatena contorta TaxID=39482 RepID=A0A315ZWB0_9FIRM|nr:hypothetical protein [Faecalicatena contorta]PWJ49158.1 hypothetical protein A8805_10888 [Faecalicatena contorta]SUQ14863.1 hypothetical protein SAMN05216529_10888 [Faecalicatena contorta]
MANRRMFSLDVVDTDNFLEMPASTQSLYFHLGMRADDDGFVAAPKKITKLVNCGEDDLKLLLAKGYILALENGVIVVRHWKQNNYIQRDRYKPTIYQKEFEKLAVEDGIYGMDTGCIQDVSKLEAQVSIGKYSIDNNICSPEADERESDFEKIYAIYPKKRGKTKAFSNYCSWLKGRMVNGKRRKLTNREMYLAVHNYIRQQEAAGTELEYYKNFDTLTGNQLLDYVVKEEQHE